MKQNELEKFNAKSSVILRSAIVNYSYYEQAQNICERLNPKEVNFKVENMKLFLKDLLECNKKVLNLIENVQKRVAIRMTDCYAFDRDFQDMSFWIIKAEEGRKLLFANGGFKKYVEPVIDEYFRNLMKKNNNEEVALFMRELNQPKIKTDVDGVSVSN